MTKLELGCGKRPTPGYLHHDKIRHGDWINVTHDLEQLPWPWEDGQFEEIIALDVMEHLRLEVSDWLDEFWRILKDRGLLTLRLPAWDNPLSFRDPTHRRVFHEESFEYWDPGKQLYRDFGSFYFSASNRWWKVQQVKRCVGVDDGKSQGVRDLCYLLRKRAPAPDSPTPTPTSSSIAATSSTRRRSHRD